MKNPQLTSALSAKTPPPGSIEFFPLSEIPGARITRKREAIALHFVEDKRGLVLDQVEFVHPLLDAPKKSVRANSFTTLQVGAFRWSRAVKALCILLLRHRLSDAGCLEGESNSLAASLDYALNKKPVWLLDMFGVDKDGKSLLLRLLARTNSELKSPGPVRVSVRQERTEFSVTVHRNNAEQRDAQEIAKLLTLLEDDAAAPPRVIEHDASPALAPPPEPLRALPGVLSPPANHKAFLLNICVGEAQRLLQIADIFAPADFSRRLKYLQDNRFLQKLNGSKVQTVGPVCSGLTGLARLGIEENDDIVRKPLAGDRPLRIALSVTSISAIALLQYLRSVKGLNIILDFSYAETTEIAQRMCSHGFTSPPDGCLLTLPATATYLGRTPTPSYRPFMLLSRTSHSVVAPAGTNNVFDQGQYCFMADRPGTSMFFFEALKELGVVTKRNVEVKNMEPDEILSSFANSDSSHKAILFFPHNVINKTYNHCQILDVPIANADSLETVLLLEESLCGDKELALALNVAIRDAWLSFLERPELLKDTLSKLFDDEKFFKLLYRCCGLYKYPAAANLLL